MPRCLALAFDPTDPEERGDYFRVLMRRQGVSTDQVAAHGSVSKGLVSSFLNGRKNSVRVGDALCDLLDLDPSELSYRKSEKGGMM